MEHSSPSRPSIARALRILRVARGLSQTDVAAAIGRTRQTLSAYEREDGGAIPPDEVLAQLASLYSVGVNQLRLGLLPNVLEQSFASDVERGYALSDSDLAEADAEGGSILRMPPAVYDVAFPLLESMKAAKLSRAAQDQVEVFVTHLAHGLLTPDNRKVTLGVAVQDARDAVEFWRAVYQRRGIALVLPEPLETDDPDAMTGEEFVARLSTQRRKPQAG